MIDIERRHLQEPAIPLFHDPPFMKFSHFLFSLFFLHVSCVSRIAVGQDGFTVPGPPKGDLFTELMQCWMYCKSAEKQLDRVEEEFPELALEVLNARANWMSSPFATGGRAIEKDILEKTGGKAEEQLTQLQEQASEVAEPLTQLNTIEEARAFLDLMVRRSKGEIELDMVRSNLLWQCPSYQEHPEKEFEEGFVTRVTHDKEFGYDLTFDIPMSWKKSASQNSRSIGFINCYGHGNFMVVVTVSNAVDSLGNPLPVEEVMKRYSEETIRSQYTNQGMEISSFVETKLNGMPAQMFDGTHVVEQLGEKTTTRMNAVLAYTDGMAVSFSTHAKGPESTDTLKRNEKLFRKILTSLKIDTDGEWRIPKKEEPIRASGSPNLTLSVCKERFGDPIREPHLEAGSVTTTYALQIPGYAQHVLLLEVFHTVPEKPFQLMSFLFANADPEATNTIKVTEEELSDSIAHVLGFPGVTLQEQKLTSEAVTEGFEKVFLIDDRFGVFETTAPDTGPMYLLENLEIVQ